jgi:hypothetical protein
MSETSSPDAAELHLAPLAADATWLLSSDDLAAVPEAEAHNRLGFGVLLGYFRREGRFPEHPTVIPEESVARIAGQLEVPVSSWQGYVWGGSTWKRHRREIRARLGFRPCTVQDGQALAEWLGTTALGADRNPDHLAARLRERCRSLCLEPPTVERIQRIVRTAVHQYEQRLFARIHARLPPEVCIRLDALLYPAPDEEAAEHPENSTRAVLIRLRADAGRPSVRSVQDELAKLALIRSLALPDNLFHDVSPQEVELYRQRVAVEAPYELRRHGEPVRRTWLAAYAYLRGRQIIDTLVDLLIDTIHHIGARAERKVEREMLEDLKRVSGKQNLLFRIAVAALEHPDAVVREVVFPIAGEPVLRALVKEWKATGPTYRTTLRTVIRNSYQGHYRGMVPSLLESLVFRSNNESHRPVIQALDLLKRYAATRVHNYPVEEEVPLEGVVKGLWREAVVGEDPSGQPRVNRITYEICALEALREKLRCKEIWVEGADRYRNPEQDLPQDFEVQRAAYYAALELPTAAEAFTETLQHEMVQALQRLDATLGRNPHVRIKPSGQIGVTPLAAQAEPQHLAALKAEIADEYPMTSLLDMLKEADLRLGFTDAFRTAGSHEQLDRRTLQTRLLLCLHGMGTNAGLRRMHATQNGTSYKDLLYTRNRYINADRLREAITTLVNGTLRARQAAVWGEGTTACASDSKHFGEKSPSPAISGPPNRSAASSAARHARAARIMALDGTQPTLRQSPPSSFRSTKATLAPSAAAIAAVTRPAVPPPTTTRW